MTGLTAPALAAELADLHLLRPAWLLALLALPLLGLWWRRKRLRASAWRTAVDPHLLPHLVEANAGRRGRLGLFAAALAYAIAVVALAGPSWEQVAHPTWRAPAPLVVAMDLSSATTAADLPPSRLLQARAKVAQLLREREGGQVGLVAWAGDAFTVAPLTDDAANVALFLDALDPSIMPVDGQRADRAIEWSARLLRQAGFAQGDILLLTDHADADAIAAAAAARAAGYRVSVLGLGTTAGAAYRAQAGGIEHARLEPDSLAALAAAGDGRYAPLAADGADLAALGVLAPPMAGVGREAAGAPAGRHWQDGGYWLLPALMLLALLAFRRGGAVVAVLLLAWLPMRPAQAMEWEDLWRRPEQQAHAQLRAGAEAYRDGEFERAARAWRQVPGPVADYNRGNALAKARRYREAIQAYDEALARAPRMEDAIANRAAVQALLDRQPPGPGDEGEQDGQGGQGGQGEPGGDGDQGAPADGDGTGSGEPRPGADAAPRDEDGAGDGEPRQGDQGTQPAEDPAAAAEQRAADAAQRERMARALAEGQAQDGPPEGRAPGAAPEGETEAERERRIANAAWLQRIPDDPGGLLRRKFALEYQRRQREGLR